MTVNNYTDRLVEYTPLNAIELKQDIQEGRWWYFRRVYALKSEDGKIYAIRLNWFERVKAHLFYFGMDNFFKKVFENRKFSLIEPLDVVHVAKTLKIFTVPNPAFITPKNIDEYVDLMEEYKLIEIGDIKISKNPKGYRFVIKVPPSRDSNQDCDSLQRLAIEIQKGRFAVLQQNTRDTFLHSYDTLKEVLDHLFQGRFYQEDVFKTMEFLTVFGKDGESYKYSNPFLKQSSK